MKIGSVLASRYEIVREVGRGGMGVVYLARDVLLERDVAVKLLAGSQLSAEAEDRFRREARVVAKMDHPSIVPLHDFARHEDFVFLVMPFVQGMSLRNSLLERPIPIVDVLEIALRVAEALEYSHSLGVIHRDIKPENIMVEREASGTLRVRVADFGIAAAEFEERVTKSGVILGTGMYLSPEQIGEADVDARSDLYSLGVVLYECLSGRPPFGGSGSSLYYRITFGSPKRLTLLRPDTPSALEEIVHRCLEKAPARRPPNARALADALLSVRATLEGLPPTGAQLPPMPSRTPHTTIGPPFVGRERELSDLTDRLTSAMLGEAQLALVGGDAGIGKSRLLDELEGIAAARTIRVLHGRFLDRDRSFPFQAFCDVLQEHLLANASVGSDGPDLGELAPDLAALFPALGEIPAMRTTPSTASETTSGSRQRFGDQSEVFELLARALAKVGGGAPLLVLLEDLHSSDVSVEALQYIVRRLSATPTLFVATYRTSEIHKEHPLNRLFDAFEGERRFTSVRLEPLSRDLQRELARGALAGGGAEDALLDRVADAAEGNPFFVVELVRSLVDSGEAKAIDGTWTISPDFAPGASALPETIHQAVERRLRTLEPDAREVLAIGAVLGRRFEFDDLEAFADGIANVEDTVEWLVDVGLLKEESEVVGDTISFASSVVREVVYNRLSRRKRKSLHRAAALRLERRSASRPDRTLPQLLHHFAAADVPEKAVMYGLRLARRAVEAFAYDEALSAVETVLKFVVRIEPSDPRHEAEARTLAAAAHRIAGDGASALEELERAATLYARAGESRDFARVAALAAEIAWESRDMGLATRWVEKGLGLSGEGPASGSSRIRLLQIAATLATLRGEPSAAAALLVEANETSPVPADIDLDPHGVLTVGFANRIGAVHPVDASNRDEREILSCVFDTLCRIDGAGVAAPYLCDRIELSDDSRTCTLSLRRGVTAHNGSVLDARAVKAAMEAAVLRAQSLPRALAAIAGVDDFRRSLTSDVTGLVVRGDTELVVHLVSACPLFATFLTDPRTAIATVPDDDDVASFAGTGRFALASAELNLVTLSKWAEPWNGAPANVEQIRFIGGRGPEELAGEVRAGRLDIARDVADESVDELLRDRRRRFRLVETTARGTWFLLFNTARPQFADRSLRASVTSRLRIDEMVRSALSSASYPAVGLIPPHTRAHDPNQRRPQVEGPAFSASSGRFRLGLADAFRRLEPALVDVIVDRLRACELDVEVIPVDESSASCSIIARADLDALLTGWDSDYADPSEIATVIFDPDDARGHECLAAVADGLLLESTIGKAELSARARACRRLEAALVDELVVVPLFHSLDRRLVASCVARVDLGSEPPFLSYSAIGKRLAAEPTSQPPRAGGSLVIPVHASYESGDIDPARARRALDVELLSTVFETLTRVVDSAQAVPWLAAHIVAENGGRRYRFRLREALRFHDGRPVTARDVRYSFERLLLDPKSAFRGQLAVIAGAKAMLSGESLHLSGFRITSRLTFTIELDTPIAFFPALLSHAAASIVPEGSRIPGSEWTDIPVGTGPFKVARFSPGASLELEPNPAYWRREYPRADRLVFTLGATPQKALADFSAGRASVIASVLPEDEEVLRRSREYAAGCREAPLLQTVLVAFNTHRGPFADPVLRQHVARSMGVDALVERTVGRRAVAAEGLIPPGLVGFETTRRTTGERFRSARLATPVRVSCLMRPLFVDGSLSAFRRGLFDELETVGIHATIAERDGEDWERARDAADEDMFLLAWTADYPDADTFAYGLLHSENGWLGRFCGSPELDRLVERARSTADTEFRHDLYRELEASIARRALLLPFFHERSVRFARPEVRGLEVSFAPPFVAYEKLWVER